MKEDISNRGKGLWRVPCLVLTLEILLICTEQWQDPGSPALACVPLKPTQGLALGSGGACREGAL